MDSSSLRMQAVQAPIIPTVGEMIRNRPGTISLGQGVAYYGPPAAALERIRSFGGSLADNLYGPVQGIPKLHSLIRAKLLAENGIDCERGRRVVVTAGANMAFLNALFAITDPGDEVILPLPYYFNQEMAARMLNCKPVPVPTDARYQLQPDLIRAAVTGKTRAIVTVSPNNPTGAVYPEGDLREINALCREKGIYHISDEAYENFVYGDVRHVSPGAFEDAAGHTISLYSLSKAYGFAGWRVGYMVIPEHLYAAVLKVQDTNLICPALVSQHAAAGALETGSAYCREKLKPLARVRESIRELLRPLKPFCTIPEADGAFYLLIRIHTGMEDMALVERLVDEYRVAAIPGRAFGLENGCYLRIAFGALEPLTAEEGIRRLVRGVCALTGGSPPA